MATIQRPPVSDEPPGPRVTPYFTRVLEAEAARRGLPPEA